MMTRRPTNLRSSSARIAIVAGVIAGLAAPPAYATVATTTVSAQAYFRVKREKVTPEKAAAARADVQVKANALHQTGDTVGGGVALDEGAAVWGDPVLFLDAADMYLLAAQEQKDTGLIDAAEERARIARDILFYHLDSTADASFKLVPIGDVPGLISRAEALLNEAGPLRDSIVNAEPEEEEDEEEEDKPKKKRSKKKILFGTGVAAATIGGALLLVGVAGLGIGAARQVEAEDNTVYGDEYDAVAAKGEQGNLIAGLGFGFGGAFAIAGATLIILSKAKPRKGKKKKKKKKDDEDAPEDDNVVRVGPTFGAGHSGLAVTGRF